MKWPKIREVGEALKSLFSKAYTTRYPFVPTVPPDGFRGKPQYDEKNCVGCLACYEVCPARAIDYIDDVGTRQRLLTHHPEICIYCQQCEKACITEKGIKLTKEYELAGFERRSRTSQSKKELVICDNCETIVGCLDHLKYLARKVGSLLYTNPTLMLANHAAEGPYFKAGHLRMLCPSCRREMILGEQW